MEVYILDDLLRRETVIDRFESCIWTERYSAFGDFQLVIHSTVQSRGLLTKGTQLAINNSRRVMTIENVENKEDSEGRSLLTATGRSLESVLLNRPNRRSGIPTGAPATVKWATTGTPGGIARTIFDTILRSNTIIPADNLPFLAPGSLYPPGTIAEPDVTITYELGYGNMYESIKELCDIYGLGFRLYRGPDNSQLYFDVYPGNDRTASQTALPAVIFSPDLENLTNTSEFSSIETYKNIAYVIAPNGTRIVYDASASENTSGFNRRILMVDANDIELPAGTELQDALEKRGKDELTKNRALTAMDGELTQDSGYIYGVDYDLGDLVEMRNDDGVTNRMRVTEQIFVDDAQGERSYPTLALDVFIQPGTWYAWDSNGVWDTAPGYWEDQPE